MDRDRKSCVEAGARQPTRLSLCFLMSVSRTIEPTSNFFGNVRLNGDWKMTRSGEIGNNGLASRKIVPDGEGTYAVAHTRS